MVLGKVYRLSYRQRTEDTVSSFVLEHRNDKSESLVFEKDAIAILTGQELDAIRPDYHTVCDAYGCLGVLQLTLDSNPLLFLVLVNGCVSVGKVLNSEIFRITDTTFVSLRNNPADLEKIQEIRKVLNSGAFFFSWSTNTTDNEATFDITLCAQRRARTNDTDNRFFWNRMLHCHPNRFGVDTRKWLIKAMCGGISISTVYVGSQQAKACLISRLSSERAGTRFNVRGTNDDGHVANFVETEQVIYLDQDRCSSYVLIRGSVPLFWEQPGINVGSHKIKMSRGPEVSHPAYERHLLALKKRYGRQHLITLMGSKEGETMLTKMYKNHHTSSQQGKEIRLVAFDYHAECPRGRQDNLSKKLKYDISKSLDEFGFYAFTQGRMIKSQAGTFRVNCVDCLDRTNCVQTFIGLEILNRQLHALGLDEKPQIAARFVETYRNMWTQNGDACAVIYAGTGAMDGRSKIKDSTLSVARSIQNNLLDYKKQEAMDILLVGKALNNEYADRARSLLTPNYLHLPPSILRQMCDRHLDYTTPKRIKVRAATWNVNGGKHFDSVIYRRSDPLSDWLVDFKKSRNTLVSLDDSTDDQPADIYAIGFEEIVDLNASNIMAASTTNQREWLVELKQSISRDHTYVLVTSSQLVGVCLFIFVRQEHARYIRDVCVDQVKTGLGGATGNKGGVVIRFRFHSTSMAFVCAHFAAGQKEWLDRNADYAEITRKVSFPLSRSLNTHDYVFWVGDFNYRIDMPRDEVVALVQAGDLKTLLEKDQLTVQMRENAVFKNYREAPITFAPTYKYDMHSDDYDSSEKHRIPAWTDRVLFKKTHRTRKDEDPANLDYGHVCFYGRAELRTSDHRPVIAEIDLDVLVVDEDRREDVFRQVIEAHGPPDGCIQITLDGEVVEGFSHALINTLVQTLAAECGEILRYGFAQGSFQIHFEEGSAALRAAELDGILIGGQKLSIRLRTSDWADLIESELDMAANNTVPLSFDDSMMHHTADDEDELLNESVGPDIDPHALIIDESDLSGERSGGSTPSTHSYEDADRAPPSPSRPQSAPGRPAPPSRPPAPVKMQSLSDSPKKLIPARPAPPPPPKPKPNLQHQAALVPPTITKTCPSTDSEPSMASFEKESTSEPTSVPPTAGSTTDAVFGDDAWPNEDQQDESDNDDSPSSQPPPGPPPRLDSLEDHEPPGRPVPPRPPPTITTSPAPPKMPPPPAPPVSDSPPPPSRPPPPGPEISASPPSRPPPAGPPPKLPSVPAPPGPAKAAPPPLPNRTGPPPIPQRR